MMDIIGKASRKKISAALAVIMTLSVVITASIVTVATARASVDLVNISEAAGYYESAYAEWSAVDGADGYVAYVKKATEDDSAYVKLDNELIREYTDYYRVDALGLCAGEYVIKVVPYANGEEIEGKAAVTDVLTVMAYDRSGFAFSTDSTLQTGSGAYNDDGTLKSDAIVIYIYGDTAKTVSASIQTGKNKYTTCTGLQAIIDAYQKGYETRPLDVRLIGNITADNIDYFSSSSEGLQIKGKKSYSNLGITIEGVGEDASVYGFGFLLRNAGNVEIRNFSILYFMDDGISIDTDNCNIWVHNMDIYYGKSGSDSDQAKGDGSIDIKGNSQYVTVSYVHFYDSGKCSLCGMKSESGANYITYHHNWFDHSDSRMARIRTMSVHLYNNYYDGNSKYGVGVTTGASAFVENNYFRACAHPLLSSLQGSDIANGTANATFSGEKGGIIKAYNNIMVDCGSVIYANTEDGNSTSFDAYLATTRDEIVSSDYVTLSGSTTYDNFDTTIDLGVDEEDIDAVEDVPTIVTSTAGSQGGGVIDYTFTEEDDASYAVSTELLLLVKNYTNTALVCVGGLNSVAADKTEVVSSSETETTQASTASETTEQQTTTSQTEATTIDNNISSTSYVQNFTTDGTSSTFYSITGNLSDSKGSVTYNGLTLNVALKMETATSITFTAPADGKLTLVFGGSSLAANKKIKINGEKVTIDSSQILTVDVSEGTVTITKGDSINLFYMVYQSNEYVVEDESTTQETSSKTEASTESQTSSETTTKETISQETSTQGDKSDDTTTSSKIVISEYDSSNTTYSGTYTSYSQASDSDFANAIYVSSSEEILAAIKTVKAGQAIIVADGTYTFDSTIVIEEANSGSANAYKILRAATGATVVFDFSSMEENSANRGVVLDGDYWYVNNINFYGAGDNGMLLSGSNNIIEGCIFEANHDTGLQLSRYNTSYSDISQWPSNNLILNCTAFDNCDIKTQENADGFAAKLTCGEGNVFDGCISYCNSDDGWDLYAKTATGPIGVVTIRNCVSFGNGKTTTGTSFGSGDMNGFKLGGSGVGTAHVVFNCLAFNNGATGFTDNNNPSNLSITNCTAASNGSAKKANFVCYRSAKGATYRNLISYNNLTKQSDKFNGYIANSIYYTNSKYYYVSSLFGIAISNGDKLGDTTTLTDSNFLNVDNDIDVTANIHKLLRNSDGTVNVNGLYETTGSLESLGAHFNVASQMIIMTSIYSGSDTESESQTQTEATSSTSSEEITTVNDSTEGEDVTNMTTESGTEAVTKTTTEVAADTDIVYEMITGTNVTIGLGEALTLRSSADYSLFVGVKVDGNFIATSNYESYSGSTIVVISADYISTLLPGEHEFVIVSKDGSATTSVTISDTQVGDIAADEDTVISGINTDDIVVLSADTATESTTTSVTTRDSNNIVLYIIIAFVTIVLFVGGTSYIRKITK